jgi:3-oxoacyl-[acyl-carrier-protein] synthase III
MKAKITGIGHYLPNKVVSNDDLATQFDITAERIFQKTGIRQRHYLETGSTSHLVIKAIKNLIGDNSYKLNDLDCLILGTTTPDYFFPATATAILTELNVKSGYGFDVSAACSGFMYGLHIGRLMIESGEAKKIIICGGDKLSSTLTGHDYKTAVLFGDGAGAVMLEATEGKDENYLYKSICSMKKGGLSEVYLKTGLNSKNKTFDGIHMEGRLVYESGVTQMAKSITDYLELMNLTFDDIDYLVPHQANLRMLEAVANKLGLSVEKMLINIETMGNTGSATIPICLSQHYEKKLIKKGDRLLLVGFGAGYSSSVCYLKWNI